MQSSCYSHALLLADSAEQSNANRICRSSMQDVQHLALVFHAGLLDWSRRLLVAFRHCHQTQNYNFDLCLTYFVFGLKFVSTRFNGRVADLYVLLLTSKRNLLKPCLHLPP